MSDVLQRLVGRALGEPAGSLRPRRPSRFESAPGEPGFRQIHAEEPAAVVPPSRHAGEASPVEAPTRAARRDPAATPVPEFTEEQGLSDRPAPQPATRPDRPAAVHAASPPPSSSRLPSDPPREVAPLPEPAAPRRPAPASAPAAPGPPIPAPGPLLPEAVPVLSEAGPDMAPEASGAGDPAMPAGEDPGPPDITIHIGHLDVRAEPARPPRPARQEPRRKSLPSLSDYLRGDSS